MLRVLFFALVATAAAAGTLSARIGMVDPPVDLQTATPGTQQVGNTNVSGTMLAGTVSASNGGATAQVVQGNATSATGANFGGLFRSSSTSGTGVRGVASASSGATNGGTFQAAAPSGAGARGFHTATNGVGFGVFGQSASIEGVGVKGISTAASGTGIGVFGTAASPNGLAGFFDGPLVATGKLGIGTSNPQRSVHVVASATGFLPNFTSDRLVLEATNQPAILLLSGSTGSAALRFQAGSQNMGGVFANFLTPGGLDLTTGNQVSRLAIASSGNVGIGTTSPSSLLDVAGTAKVAGFQMPTGAAADRVLKSDATGVGTWQTDSLTVPFSGTLDSGVLTTFAVANTHPDSCRALRATCTSSIGFPLAADFSVSAGVAVRGTASANGGSNFAGQFVASSPTGIGVQARITAVSGTTAAVDSGTFSPNGTGVIGRALDNTGPSIGVHGRTASLTDGFGVFSTGKFTATGTKSFRIDNPLDPLNSFLMHYCSEGPEPLNVYSGTAKTDAQGTAWVRLPAYFEEINKDYRYQLTVVEDEDTEEFVQVKVAKRIAGGKFKIRTSQPNVEVCWQVTGVRNDRFVREYGAPVIVEKPVGDRGTYQHPELYGVVQPAASR